MGVWGNPWRFESSRAHHFDWIAQARMSRMSEMTYVLIDGDGIGEKIDALMLQNELAKLAQFTRGIDGAVARIASMARDAGAAVHMAGGDNVLLAVADVDPFLDAFEAARASFCCSFSAGIGSDSREAHLALQVAKRAGSGAIVRARTATGGIAFTKRAAARTWTAV